ncbi:MAG: S1 RNA-binding domain-containing protein [Bacteroidota bacterium]
MKHFNPDFEEGTIVKGKITRVERFGAFLEFQTGITGLIHSTEITWTVPPPDPVEFFKIGDTHKAMIVAFDPVNQKVSLSLKRLSEDPWHNIEEKYPVGSRHLGDVSQLMPYGMLVELEEGVIGIIKLSDLSWSSQFSHPGEYKSEGDLIEVIIADIDIENRKISLGHRQIKEKY